MKKINPENINVGNYFFIVDKDNKDRKFMINKTPNKRKGKSLFKWWALNKKLEPKERWKGITAITTNTLQDFDCFELNQEELEEFTKRAIILNLEENEK